MLGGVGTGD